MNPLNFKSITAANYAAIAVLIITIGLISSGPSGDGDLWWQMLYGKYMIENLTLIPDHSVFSWTIADNTWMYCAWIAEILLYSIHSIAGLPGLYVLRYLVALLPMALLLWVGKQNRSATPTAVWLGFLVCYFASFGYGGMLKPEMLSFLLFSLTVAVYFKLKTEPNNWKLCYLFPVVMLVWVNTHGGFFVGMFFLGVAVVGELANYLFRSPAALPRDLLKHLVLSAGLTLVALCCNPYGIYYPIQVVTNILGMNAQHFSTVEAYDNIFKAGIRQLLYLGIGLFLTVPLFIEQIVRRKVDFAVFLISAIFIVLYVSYARMSYFYVTIMVFSLQYFLAVSSTWQTILCRQVEKVQLFSWGILLVMVALSTHEIQDRYRLPSYAPMLSFKGSYLEPKTESEFIVENLGSHKVCNGYAGGGYLMWRLWPNQKVMIDPRYFPYASWFDEWSELKKKNAYGQLAKFNCNLWVINYRYTDLVGTINTSPDWKLVFVGFSSAVFVKKSSIQGEWETQAGDDLLHMRDPERVIPVLDLLVSNTDYSLALKLSRIMIENFQDTEYEEHFVKAEAYTKGVRAYSQQDYGAAYDLLSKSQVKPAPLSNEKLHTHANLFLVEQLMEGGRYKDALRIALEGVEIAPNDLYTLFNAGSLSIAFSEEKVGPQKWKEYFTKFVSLTKQNPKLVPSDIVASVQSALANEEMIPTQILTPQQP